MRITIAADQPLELCNACKCELSRCICAQLNLLKNQEDKWVKGESIHIDLNGGTCCPDFSCCNPGMLWPKTRRLKFHTGTESERRDMMHEALVELMDYHEKRRVYVALPQPPAT